MKRVFLALLRHCAQMWVILSLLGALAYPMSVYAQTPFPQTAAQVNALSPGEAACRFVKTNQGECTSCFQGGGAWTAVGCLGGADPNAFIASFIKIGIGLGSGVAFLLILLSGFQRITSTGNPEKIHESKELMTAAISGLLLIIFSVFLLRLIGVNILQIPGFS
jgi:hypothetical protein